MVQICKRADNRFLALILDTVANNKFFFICISAYPRICTSLTLKCSSFIIFTIKHTI